MSEFVGAAIGAASNLIGNIASAASARKQRKFIREENQKNRDFQERMVNEQNKYNSASEQRKRLEEAGLNPYLMMNGGTAGTASGASASGSSSGSPSLPNFEPIASSIGNTMLSFASAIKSMKEAEGVDIRNNSDSQFLNSERSSALGNTQADTLLKGMQSNLAKAQEANLLLDGEAKQVLNSYLPQEKQIELQTMGASYSNLIRDGRIKEEEARNLIASRLEIEARTAGQKISNKVALKTADAIISSTYWANVNSAIYDKEASKYAKNRHAIDYNSSLRDYDWRNYDYKGRKVDRFLNRMQQGVGIGTSVYNSYKRK